MYEKITTAPLQDYREYNNDNNVTQNKSRIPATIDLR